MFPRDKASEKVNSEVSGHVRTREKNVWMGIDVERLRVCELFNRATRKVAIGARMQRAATSVGSGVGRSSWASLLTSGSHCASRASHLFEKTVGTTCVRDEEG